MINKKYLINKLLDYPDISHNDYRKLIKEKNKLMNSSDNIIDIDNINNINNRIKLYNEKELIIQMIKQT